MLLLKMTKTHTALGELRLIEQMGIENYVQLQTKPNESGAS